VPHYDGAVARPRGSVPVPVARLPSSPGVYRFRDARGRVLYLGRAVDLRRRVGSYWGGLGDRPRLARMVVQIAGPEAVGCASEHEAAWMERVLPIAYAADRQGGFARDMARIRGANPTDRDQMIEEVVAVLERQPDAVDALRVVLVARRDQRTGSRFRPTRSNQLSSKADAGESQD
jgi:hypothetical protein